MKTKLAHFSSFQNPFDQRTMLGCGLPVLMKNIFDHIPHSQLTIDFWHEKPKTIIMACHSIQLNLGSTHEVQWCVTRYPKSEKWYTIFMKSKSYIFRN